MNMQISLLAYNLHTCVVQRLRFNLISISFSYYYQRKNTLKYINLTKYSPPPVQIITTLISNGQYSIMAIQHIRKVFKKNKVKLQDKKME